MFKDEVMFDVYEGSEQNFRSRGLSDLLSVNVYREVIRRCESLACEFSGALNSSDRLIDYTSY